MSPTGGLRREESGSPFAPIRGRDRTWGRKVKDGGDMTRATSTCRIGPTDQAVRLPPTGEFHKKNIGKGDGKNSVLYANLYRDGSRKIPLIRGLEEKITMTARQRGGSFHLRRFSAGLGGEGRDELSRREFRSGGGGTL